MIRIIVLALILVLLQTVECDSQRLANVQFIGCGVDMTGAQPIEYYIRQPIVDLTYNSSVYMNGIKYIVPSQIQVIATPHTDEQTTTRVYYNSSQVVLSLYETSTFGLKSPFKLIPGMYKNSNNQLYFYEQTTKYGNYSSDSYLRVLSFRATLIAKQVELYQQFVKLINSLPPVYNGQTRALYQKVFSLYGTHMIIAAQYGGLVTSQTSASISYVNTIQESQYINDLTQQFLLMSSTTTLNQTQSQQLTELNYHYNSVVKLIGGNPGLFPVAQWPQWALTVIDNSQILSYDLIPIWKLLESHHFSDNPHRKEIYLNLRQATLEYLMPGNFVPVHQFPDQEPYNSISNWLCDNSNHHMFYCLATDDHLNLVYGFSFDTKTNTIQKIYIPTLTIVVDTEIIATTDYLYLLNAGNLTMVYMDLISQEWHILDSINLTSQLILLSFKFNDTVWFNIDGASSMVSCRGNSCIEYSFPDNVQYQLYMAEGWKKGVAIDDKVYFSGDWGYSNAVIQFVILDMTTIITELEISFVNSTIPGCLYGMASLTAAKNQIYSFESTLCCNAGVTNLDYAIIYDPIENRFGDTQMQMSASYFNQDVVFVNGIFYWIDGNIIRVAPL